MDKRLFFALWPDDRQRDRIADTLQLLLDGIDGRPVPRDNWHVTLVFLGNCPAEHIDSLQHAASTVRIEPVELCFDRFDYWPKPRIACLEAGRVPPPLKRLVGRLADVVREVGVEPDARPYRPHITAARPARPFDTRSLAQPLELQWARFELLESVSLPTGVSYRPLKQGLPHVS